ncbi:MAG: acyl-CoA thioesterase [Desulfovibrionaceae bacterium]|nr:acyl-CoA thioesterase [Desulfovibrionaceae bacterium]
MKNIEPLSFWFAHRVSYRETDTMAVVYYAEYLYFFERARTEYIRNILSLSYYQLEQQGYFLPVTHVDCTYKHSIRYDEYIQIKTYISQCKRASLIFSYEIYNEEKSTLYALGTTTLACIDRNGKPCKLPDIFTTKYNAL